MRTVLLNVLGFFLLVSAANAGQLWTTVGSAGTIDPAQIANAAVGMSSVGFSTSSSSTAAITVRYNVTIDGTTAPTWGTIELLANDAGLVNGVIAVLYSVNRTTGANTLISAIGTSGSGTTQAYTFAIGTSVTFDFTNNYYVIVGTLSRTSTSAFPNLRGLRLY